MIVVVVGPPCAGKSTLVDRGRAVEDLVIDLDRIAHALGYPTEQIDWSLEHLAREAARAIRVDLIDQVLAEHPDPEYPGAHVWIVDSAPNAVARRAYRDSGAVVVAVNPGLDVCMSRAEQRAIDDDSLSVLQSQITRWFAEHSGRWPVSDVSTVDVLAGAVPMAEPSRWSL